jgi:hypothetical protein
VWGWLRRWLRVKPERGPVQTELGDALIRAIESVLEAAPATFPFALKSQLSQAQRKLARPDIRIAFGGLFKAGKSTLLNAIIGQDLLPSNDLAETGAPAQIRVGPVTEIHVHRASGIIEAIGATREHISTNASLRLSDGQRRRSEDLPKLVDISLPSFPFSAHITLVDVPGLNDKEEVSKSAAETLMQSDFIFWVFRTDPEFSEQDVAAIAAISPLFSMNQFTFVLNARLAADDARHWANFRKSRVAPALEKVMECMEKMGFEAGSTPSLAVVSARSMRLGKSRFGGKAFRKIVSGIAALASDAVIELRLPAARAALSSSAEWARLRVVESKSAFDAAAARHNAYLEAQQKRDLLEAQLRSSVRSAFATMSRELSGLGSRHADRISNSGYQSGIAYGPALAADASAVVIRVARSTYGQCERTARELFGMQSSDFNRYAVFGAFSLLGGADPDVDASISRGIAEWAGNLYSPSVEKNFFETIEGWFGSTNPRDRTAASFRDDVRARAGKITEALLSREGDVLKMMRQCFPLPNNTPVPAADPIALQAAERFHLAILSALAVCDR